MSDWSESVVEAPRDSLLIEELNANNGISQRITGIKISDTVEVLKRCIAVHLRNPGGWSSIEVAFAGQNLINRGGTIAPQAKRN
jgi:hypothetical protein